MSESTASTLDPAKRKTKTFGKQLSKSFEKSFQKGKEAMKRGLLTPRGARAQQKPAAEAPENKAQVASTVPNIPKASVLAQDPVHKASDIGVASKSVNGVAAVKATIQAKEDSPAPVAVVLEPTEDAVSHEVTGPATPVPMPAIKPVPVADHTVELSEPQKTVAPAALHTAEEAEPPVEEGSGAPEEELGFAPPNVTVTVTGTPTDESKAAVAAEVKETTPYVKSKKAGPGGVKKALLGVLVLAAASAAGLAVRGGHAH
ncbi:hypothetical protein COCOBI_07-3960 [Coccomyxa sp. Obi]|nr:hypothetical protein COCOBI_07-3960 [Coccomyxa sp. Obi]